MSADITTVNYGQKTVSLFPTSVSDTRAQARRIGYDLAKQNIPRTHARDENTCPAASLQSGDGLQMSHSGFPATVISQAGGRLHVPALQLIHETRPPKPASRLSACSIPSNGNCCTLSTNDENQERYSPAIGGPFHSLRGFDSLPDDAQTSSLHWSNGPEPSTQGEHIGDANHKNHF